MPFVSIKGISGVLTQEQKAEMIKRVTDAMLSVEGERMRAITWVVIEEIAEGEWGVGGVGLTSADIKSIQSGEVKLSEALNFD